MAGRNPNLKISRTAHASTAWINWVVLATVVMIAAVFLLVTTLVNATAGVMMAVFISLLCMGGFISFFLYQNCRKS